MIATIIAEGLVYGIMALGVFISFRVLQFPDLTVDGTFPLGAALYAFGVVHGLPAVAIFPLVVAGGFVAGLTTALIHTKLKVPHLLAGILTMTMLYSVNLRIQDFRPNVSFLKYTTLLDQLEAVFAPLPRAWTIVLTFGLAAIVVKLLLDLFFHTDLGLSLGALGHNEQMIVSQGMNPEVLKILGLGLSNGLVALSAALAAQYLGSADVNLGRGIVIAGLASVMIGELVLRSNRIGMHTLRVLIGSTLFRGLMFFARRATLIRLRPSDLQLIYGLFIIALLAYSLWRERASVRKRSAAAVKEHES